MKSTNFTKAQMTIMEEMLNESFQPNPSELRSQKI